MLRNEIKYWIFAKLEIQEPEISLKDMRILHKLIFFSKVSITIQTLYVFKSLEGVFGAETFSQKTLYINFHYILTKSSTIPVDDLLKCVEKYMD
jgi:hypothetical protein